MSMVERCWVCDDLVTRCKCERDLTTDPVHNKVLLEAYEKAKKQFSR